MAMLQAAAYWCMTGICHVIHRASTQTAVIVEQAQVLIYCAGTSQAIYALPKCSIELTMLSYTEAHNLHVHGRPSLCSEKLCGSCYDGYIAYSGLG